MHSKLLVQHVSDKVRTLDVLSRTAATQSSEACIIPIKTSDLYRSSCTDIVSMYIAEPRIQSFDLKVDKRGNLWIVIRLRAVPESRKITGFFATPDRSK